MSLPLRNGHIVVAIDGPAASGKSSTAQWVAKDLGFRHVDSGALYRAATLAALRGCGPPEAWTGDQVVAAVGGVALVAEETSFAPHMDGCDVSEDVRSQPVTVHVSAIAQLAPVRRWVNDRVRQVALDYDVVVDGRDMGTAVFPDADLKVFLVADPHERARRRLVQRLSRRPSEEEVDVEARLLLSRDAADAAQTIQATDAFLIDTSTLTQEDQVEQIVHLARRAFGGRMPR